MEHSLLANVKSLFKRRMANTSLVRWHCSSFPSKIMNEMCDFSTASKLLMLDVAIL